MQAAVGKGRFEGPVGLMIAVVAVVVGAALLERLSRPVDRGEATPPTPLPPLLVSGWLNLKGSPAPTPETLRGRYVVVDFWATDCLPCLRSLPALAQFYARWRDRGVEVIGLAGDPPSREGAVQSAIDRVTGMDWPVAYGAGLVHEQLGVRMIPTYVLFDPDGRSVWRGHNLAALEEELMSRY